MGKACRIPLCWSKVGERPLVGPEIVDETTQNVQVIKATMKAAQDRQNNLAYKHMLLIECLTLVIGYSLKLSP